DDHEAPASEPMSHDRISRYESPVAVQKITNDVAAAASCDTASPASTARVGVSVPPVRASVSVATSASSAPANAATGRRSPTPSTRTATAPRDAPDDRPSRYGS